MSIEGAWIFGGLLGGLIVALIWAVSRALEHKRLAGFMDLLIATRSTINETKFVRERLTIIAEKLGPQGDWLLQHYGFNAQSDLLNAIDRDFVVCWDDLPFRLREFDFGQQRSIVYQKINDQVSPILKCFGELYAHLMLLNDWEVVSQQEKEKADAEALK